MKLTLITSDTVNVVKQIGFTDGELVVHVPAMPAKGTAERVTCSTLHDLADVIRSLNQKQAVVWGDYRKPENSVSVVKKGEEVNGSISRSKDFFFWPEGETVFACDYDGDEKLTAEERIDRAPVGGVIEAPVVESGHANIGVHVDEIVGQERRCNVSAWGSTPTGP